MAANKILIVDDDPVVHESLGLYLRADGFEIADAADGEEAQRMLDNDVALVVLDLMLPKKSGIDLCKDIRKTSRIPIIMLTAKGEEVDRIVGLELGADDYIVKPFSPREVTARVKAVLRRTREIPSEDAPLQFDGLTVDIRRYGVWLNGQPILCTPKEIEILYLLMSNPGQVFSREQLLSQVWGYDFFGETRTVDTHIKRLRAKLEHGGLSWGIKTIYGVGYKFEGSG